MRFFALSILLIMTTAHAEPVSQWLFEDVHNIKCDPASGAEVKVLRQCADSVGAKSQLSTMDQTAEFIVFKNLGECESKKLGCEYNNIRRLENNRPLEEQMIQQTCGNLPLLQNAIQNQQRLQKWIKTYQDSFDPMTRQVSKEDLARRDKIIAALELRKKYYEDLESNLQSSDELLSSPNIYKEIHSRLEDGRVFSASSPEQTCRYLQSNTKDLLEKEARTLRDSKQKIDNSFVEGTSWLNEETFKKDLWAGTCKDALVHNLSGNKDLIKSTYCRNEGRYGEGLEMRDHIASIAMLALGVETGAVARFASMLYKLGKTTDAVVVALKATVYAEGAARTAIALHQRSEACGLKLQALANGSACAATDAEYASLAYKKMEVAKCIQTTISFAVSTGLMGLSTYANLAKITKGAIADDVDQSARETEELIDRSPAISVVRVVVPTNPGGTYIPPLGSIAGTEAPPLVTRATIPANKAVPFSQLNQEQRELLLAHSNEIVKSGPGSTDSFLQPPTKEYLAQISSFDKRTKLSQVFADDKGKPIAFLFARFENRAGKSGRVRIDKLAVQADARGGGVARKLLHDLSTQAINGKRPEIELLVLKSNTRAIEYYKKLGFRNITDAEPSGIGESSFRLVINSEDLEKATGSPLPSP